MSAAPPGPPPGAPPAPPRQGAEQAPGRSPGAAGAREDAPRAARADARPGGPGAASGALAGEAGADEAGADSAHEPRASGGGARPAAGDHSAAPGPEAAPGARSRDAAPSRSSGAETGGADGGDAPGGPAPEADALARAELSGSVDPVTGEPLYPFQRLLGFRIEAWSEGYARVALEVDPARHANRYGLPHGGVHAALIDTAAGFAGCWCPHPGRVRRAMTLSLTINYLGQLRGRRMIAEARQTGGGRKTFFAEVDLHDETGAPLAKGVATMRWRGAGGDPMGDPA
ncbi:PaaI family thioesterase [Oceanicella actignis]|uniref:PaaI family thioesterase n=1 Tax=Oceanicella actignis TaxID=1189325 RepID=UPI0011E7A8BA|nr:PaaI family thioesterase [Oceanicella actignis]TYO91242.1 uncharacterized protein (TIGR00369 family) [Oceanicella actignis]